jgi:calcium-dependent protein kinase
MIHKSLDHPNIVKLQEYFVDENRYYLVQEICSGGELWQKIKKHTRFTESQAKMYIK